MPEQSPFSQDPDVLAEEKKNRIWHLKLERYKEMASVVVVILQAFKSEAVSLVSGVGTLVVGWFQVRKWVIQGRHDVVAASTGQGFGIGHGRVGHARKTETLEAPPPPPKRGDTTDLMPPPGTEVVGVASAMGHGATDMTDPMNYFSVVTLLVFIGSSVSVWRKRKNKSAEGEK